MRSRPPWSAACGSKARGPCWCASTTRPSTTCPSSPRPAAPAGVAGPGGRGARPCGPAHRRAWPRSSPTAAPTRAWTNALAARALRPAGDQGRRRDLRRLHAGARDRGAGARRSGAGRGGAQGGDRRHRRRPVERAARLARGRAAEAGADRQEGLWSQYLEVGIGPDAEIFTKAQPMSAVGTGAEIGIHPKRVEQPRARDRAGRQQPRRDVGATLGNDVNLRDFEGRSALLLGKAKDNNASCAIGPFIRLFDAAFAHRRRAPRRPVHAGRGRPTASCWTGQQPLQDQPRPAGPGRAGDRAEPPVSRRLRAVPRHDVRADARPPRPRPGLHPCGGRRGRHLHAAARYTRQPRQHQRPDRTLALWRARSCATWPGAACSDTIERTT